MSTRNQTKKEAAKRVRAVKVRPSSIEKKRRENVSPEADRVVEAPDPLRRAADEELGRTLRLLFDRLWLPTEPLLPKYEVVDGDPIACLTGTIDGTRILSPSQAAARFGGVEATWERKWMNTFKFILDDRAAR